MKNKVSIIIPIYNRVHLISETLKSIRDQTYTNWELLLIDDGSTDDSLKIARSFANKHSRIFAFSDAASRPALVAKFPLIFLYLPAGNGAFSIAKRVVNISTVSP